jgi:hypothetical protein
LANTPFDDLGTEEILSTRISGIQDAVKNIEQSLDMDTEAVSEESLTLLADAMGRYRIAEAVGKRNWLDDPAPVIEQYIGGSWTQISTGFDIDYAGGAIIFTEDKVGEQFRASFTRVKNTSGHNSHLSDYAAHGVSRKNILHNWDFRNPVNQRGLTSYSNCNYTIDRWKMTAANVDFITTLDNGYITLTNNLAVYGYWQQLLERTLEDGVYTISCITSDGTLYSKAITVSGGTPITGIDVGDYAYLYVSATPSIVVRIAAGGSVSLKAIKFELGSKSTLANDPPADYGEQLALCQRYYQQHTTDTVADMDLRPSMRITPTKTAITGGYAYSADL